MTDTLEIDIVGDYAGKFSPGDKINVIGMARLKWSQLRVGEKISPLIILSSHTIEKIEYKIDRNDSEVLISSFLSFSLFEKQVFLLQKFLDELEGLIHIKLGVLLALVGGNISEIERRNKCHVLLAGDPSTGKTHILKSIIKIISPSVFINGIGTSEAGLTTCAIRQGKEWALEAGALVLSSGGICAIDGFESLKVSEKGGLLEVMEQQTLSIAKAGLVTTLNARCSIIASYNTKYKYDIEKSVEKNLKISTPLLSRFDLLFYIENKENVTKNILNRPIIKEKRKDSWSLYIFKYLLSSLPPETIISNEAQILLEKYYNRVNKQIRITFRFLESLNRLTEAFGRLFFKENVDEDAAITVIFLMETTTTGLNLIEFDHKKIFMDEKYFKLKKEELLEII